MQELLTQKQADLSRMNDRVESMRMTRPPYLVELENAEVELTKVHQEYAKKHRSLSYLESQLRAGEAIQKKKSKEKQAHLKGIQDIVNQEEKETLLAGGKGATEDQFMATPNPNKGAIPISNEQVDDGEYEEVDEEEAETEVKPQPKQMPSTFKETAKNKGMNFSENESVEEDNGEGSDEEVPPPKQASRVPPSKPAPVVADDDEYEEVYEEEEEPAKPAPAQKAPAKPAPPVQAEREEYTYEYEEESEDDGRPKPAKPMAVITPAVVKGKPRP